MLELNFAYREFAAHFQRQVVVFLTASAISEPIRISVQIRFHVKFQCFSLKCAHGDN